MAAIPTRATWTDDLELAARRLGIISLAGFVTGLLVGGVGGRLAMFLLRVTSDPRLHGMVTDDGFIVGVVSSATVFLLGVTSALGLVLALAYAAVRGWFPPAARPWIAGAFLGLAGGADLVSARSIDFHVLEPLWLAVALFVAIPATYGVVVSLWLERRLARRRPPRSRALALLPLGVFLILGPFGVALALVLFAGWGMWRSTPWLPRAWRSAPVTWLGRVAIAAIAVSGAVELVRDVTDLAS